MRLRGLGEQTNNCKARRNSEDYGVDPTATWDESSRSYLGRSHFTFERTTMKKNRCEKSAAVVLVTDHHEGPN